MRCLLINMHYPPDVAPTGQYLRDLCRALAAAGWAVRVVTAGRGERTGTTAEAGVEVVRVGAAGPGKATRARRLAGYVLFFALAGWRVLRSPGFDVVVCMTSPPFVDLLGVVHRAAFGSRLVLWSMDCYPEILARLGVLDPNDRALRVLRAVRRTAARRTDLAVAIDADMARLLRGEGYGRIACVHNWCHDALGDGDGARVTAAREEMAGQARCVVLYLGNLGAPHDFETFLGMAERLRARRDVRFVFLGGGTRWDDLRAATARRGLANVAVGGGVERAEVGVRLRAADLMLMCLLPGVRGTASPSRIYSALRAGRPVLFVGPAQCHVGRIVRESGCGEVVRAGACRRGATLVERLAQGGPRAVAEMGERGRRYYDEHFGRRRSLRALEADIEALAGGGGAMSD